MDRPRRAPLFVAAARCDDAVFGCGETIARHRGAVVAAVFGARRREDERALGVLGARALWLEQAVAPVSESAVGQVAGAVGRAFDESGAQVGLIPLGLCCAAQRLAHEGCLLAALRRPDARWLAYVDGKPCRLERSLAVRLGSLARDGIAPTRLRRVDGTERKCRAVACYAAGSGLAGRSAARMLWAMSPEGLWSLSLP